MNDLGASPKWYQVMKEHQRLMRGFSLIELLCVIGIIGILASMMLFPMGKALRKARGLVGEIEGPAHWEEMSRKYQKYRTSNKEHGILDREMFIKSCDLSSKCRGWLKSDTVTFHPFSASDSLNKIVLEYRIEVSGRVKSVQYYSLSSLLQIPKLPE
jgi:prepilin-type N-terminal cleavage/methylation domain-containing protein